MDNISLPDEQWDEQRQEREAFDRFHQALAAFMDAADAIWWCGDGHGGYVFDALINAAHQRGFPAPREASMSSRVTALVRRDGWRCYYCRTPLGWGCGDAVTPPEIDHRMPRSRGGSNRLDNLVLACKPCNRTKRDMTDDEFMAAGGGA